MKSFPLEAGHAHTSSPRRRPGRQLPVAGAPVATRARRSSGTNTTGECGAALGRIMRDGELSTSEWPLELINGCICCTTRNDLLMLLRRLHPRDDVRAHRRAAGVVRTRTGGGDQRGSGSRRAGYIDGQPDVTCASMRCSTRLPFAIGHSTRRVGSRRTRRQPDRRPGGRNLNRRSSPT